MCVHIAAFSRIEYCAFEFVSKGGPKWSRNRALTIPTARAQAKSKRAVDREFEGRTRAAALFDFILRNFI